MEMRPHARISILRSSAMLDFLQTKFLSLVELAIRKITARYKGRRSNIFPSAPFRCRALDLWVNFSDSGAPASPPKIFREKLTSVHTLALRWVQGHRNRHCAYFDIDRGRSKKYPHFSRFWIFEGAQLAPRLKSQNVIR
jgi:hypothetical protein